MGQSYESFEERVGDCIMDGSPSESSSIDTPGKRMRSLSYGGGSFVSVVGEEYDWLEREIASNRMLRGEIGPTNDRLGGVISRKNQFRKAASTLASQVSESLMTLGGSRVLHGQLVADQQRQVRELLSQMQKEIAQCKDTNTEMKQQWAMKSQFVGMQKWREDVELEILKGRGSRQVCSEKAVSSHFEAQSHLGQV